MKTFALSLLLALALLPVGTALGHNSPAIRVDPPVVAAGGTLTVIGKDMSTDTEFAITLERVGRSIPLGKVTTVAQDGGDAGFSASFTIPATTPPGSYTVRAQTQSGKVSATADLTVTAARPMPTPSEAPMAAMTPMPSAMPAVVAAMPPTVEAPGAALPVAVPAVMPAAAMPAAMPSVMPAAMRGEEASAEEHKLPMQRPEAELFGVIIAALGLAGVGTLLIVRSGAHA